MKDATLNYDVVILGGGPAGTAAALSLKKHNPSLSVTIVESSDYQKLRVGETLPPIVQPLLHQLGVWDSFIEQGHVEAYGTCSVWGSDELSGNEFFYQAYNRGWHLDRRRFDLMLAREAALRDVDLHTDSALLSSERLSDNRWHLCVRSHGKQIFIKAAFVIDATGRRAVFASQQGVGKTAIDSLLGVFMFLNMKASARSTGASTLVEAWEEGWWYSATLPDKSFVIACMSDADIVKRLGLKTQARWLECLSRTRYTKARLKDAASAGELSIHIAHSRRLERVTGEAWLAAGDAATTFDPLSSQGVSKALRSGILASYAICDYFKGDATGLEKYEALVGREFAEYLDARAEYYNQEQRWMASPFWQRRHGQGVVHGANFGVSGSKQLTAEA